MPLRKFWNALCGGSGGEPERGDLLAGGGQESTARAVQSAGATKPAGAIQPAGAIKPPVPPKRRGQNALVAAVAQHFSAAAGETTVLQIGVGDGSSAVDLITHLQSTGSVRYAAIDQFEAGPAFVAGGTRLMDFHRTLRSAGIRPQVFPDDVQTGLSQVRRTIGGVDLVVVAQGCDVAAIEPSLCRIAHAGTVVLRADGGNWSVQTLPHADLGELPMAA